MRSMAPDNDAIQRTRDFRLAEATCGLQAVCLIGPRHPVRFQTGNAMHWPVGIRTVSDPYKAAQRTASELWEGSKEVPLVVTLAYKWTESDRAALKLKAAIHARLLGEDHELRQLNGSWVDRMDWKKAWPWAVEEAVADLKAGGETVHVFDDTGRVSRILAEMKKRVRGHARF